jgi:hypothetical protein
MPSILLVFLVFTSSSLWLMADGGKGVVAAENSRLSCIVFSKNRACQLGKHVTCDADDEVDTTTTRS